MSIYGNTGIITLYGSGLYWQSQRQTRSGFVRDYLNTKLQAKVVWFCDVLCIYSSMETLVPGNDGNFYISSAIPGELQTWVDAYESWLYHLHL